MCDRHGVYVCDLWWVRQMNGTVLEHMVWHVRERYGEVVDMSSTEKVPSIPESDFTNSWI